MREDSRREVGCPDHLWAPGIGNAACLMSPATTALASDEFSSARLLEGQALKKTPLSRSGRPGIPERPPVFLLQNLCRNRFRITVCQGIEAVHQPLGARFRDLAPFGDLFGQGMGAQHPFRTRAYRG